MARSKKKKKRSGSNDQLHRSKPKHSSQDLAKAVLISGFCLALIGSLFFIQVESKPLIKFLADKVTESSDGNTSTSNESQMDRYTEQESENLDKLIEEKTKSK